MKRRRKYRPSSMEILIKSYLQHNNPVLQIRHRVKKRLKLVKKVILEKDRKQFNSDNTAPPRHSTTVHRYCGIEKKGKILLSGWIVFTGIVLADVLVRWHRHPIVPSIDGPGRCTALVTCRPGSTTIGSPPVRVCLAATERTRQEFLFLDIASPDGTKDFIEIGKRQFHTSSDPDAENDQKIKRRHQKQ